MRLVDNFCELVTRPWTVRGHNDKILTKPPMTLNEQAEELLLFLIESFREEEMFSGLPTSWKTNKLICNVMHGKNRVEIGSGTGRVPRLTIHNDLLPEDGTLVIFERNPRLLEYLKRVIKDTRVKIYGAFGDDFEDIILDEFNGEPVDSLCSTMAHSHLTKHAGAELIRRYIRRVRVGGTVLIANHREQGGHLMEAGLKMPLRINELVKEFSIPLIRLMAGEVTEECASDPSWNGKRIMLPHAEMSLRDLHAPAAPFLRPGNLSIAN